MERFYLKYQKIIRNIPLFCLFLIIQIFLTFGEAENTLKADFNSFDLLVLYFSPIISANTESVIYYILFIGKNFLYLYIFAGEFREDLKTAYAYIFTRYGDKRIWLFKKFLGLAKKVLLCLLSEFLVVFIVAMFYAGIRGLEASYILAFLMVLALNFLYVFLWVSLSNILALRFGDSLAIALNLGFITAAVFLAKFIATSSFSNKLLYLIPNANLMYTWHQGSVVQILGNLASPISGFYLWGSVLALLAGVFVIYLIFAYLLTTKDSIDLIGG